MKKITSAVLGLSMTLAVAGLSFAQTPATTSAPAAKDSTTSSSTTTTVKKHHAKRSSKKASTMNSTPDASTASPAPAPAK